MTKVTCFNTRYHKVTLHMPTLHMCSLHLSAIVLSQTSTCRQIMFIYLSYVKPPPRLCYCLVCFWCVWLQDRARDVGLHYVCITNASVTVESDMPVSAMLISLPHSLCLQCEVNIKQIIWWLQPLDSICSIADLDLIVPLTNRFCLQETHVLSPCSGQDQSKGIPPVFQNVFRIKSLLIK